MRSSRLAVLCVDDHHLVRECVAAIVEREPGLSVAGEARTLRGSLEGFTQARPDVTVVNLGTRVFDSLQAIRAIRRIDPGARIVVYAMDDTEAVYLALDAGAAAFVLKDAGASELIRVIKAVHGRNQQVLDDIRGTLGARAGLPALTTREVEILALLAEGFRVKAISASLRISDHTVKAHMRSVYEKLDVHGRAEALAEGLRRGLVRLPAARPHVVATERLGPRAQPLPAARARRLARLNPERHRPLHRARTLASGR